MSQNTETFSSLKYEQKESIGLLSIGTFLEYFDLMLYVHMAVYLNELFFPKYDAHTTSLLTALTFCTPFVFRPFGAILFGWIGDNVGRRATITLTSFLMAGCCIVMSTVPTYAVLGYKASMYILICRVIQGMASMGEIIGAELYVTETFKPPLQYAAVTLVAAFANLGTIVALIVATLVTGYGFNWRYAFGFGILVAFVGSNARLRLRETPEFVNAKNRLKNNMTNGNIDNKEVKDTVFYKEKINKKTAFCLFLMDCGWPVAFYICYFYCAGILRDNFHYTPAEIIQHNFFIALVNLLERFALTYFSYKIYPLKILKFKCWMFTLFIILTPYLLGNIGSPIQLMLLQCLIIMFGCTTLPSVPIIYKHLPVFRRFTCASLTYAFASAVIYIVTSFGLIYCTEYAGHYGILAIVIPSVIAFMYGIKHFERLEKSVGDYPA